MIALIRDIDTTKDSCIYGVSAEILKHAFQKIPGKIQIMFQKSLNLGVFPRKWAVGYVNILPKSGNLSNPGNWRPITQTCIPAKLLEKTVQTRLMKILMEQGHINEINMDLYRSVPLNWLYWKLYVTFTNL